MSKITIIGAGSWGCALANILCENKHQVLMFDHTEQTINEISRYI